VEHCQSGVCLASARAWGPAWLERALYLPKEWAQERERCPRAGMPQARPFATKPAVARRLLERGFAAGGPAAWVSGDRVYGDARRRRRWLAAHDRADGLAVSGQEEVGLGGRQRQVQTILAALPAEDWTRHSAGAGTQGPRGDDWGWGPWAAPRLPAWRRWRLGRRRVREPTALTALVVFAPQATTRAEVGQTAGPRGTIESRVAAAQSAGGLEHYAVRRGAGW
jgi:SRSO17 transposase